MTIRFEPWIIGIDIMYKVRMKRTVFFGLFTQWEFLEIIRRDQKEQFISNLSTEFSPVIVEPYQE